MQQDLGLLVGERESPALRTPAPQSLLDGGVTTPLQEHGARQNACAQRIFLERRAEAAGQGLDVGDDGVADAAWKPLSHNVGTMQQFGGKRGVTAHGVPFCCAHRVCTR